MTFPDCGGKLCNINERAAPDGGKPISSFALGTEFGIADPSGMTYWYKLVHKGVPGGGLYDSTANGAWLWRSSIAASTSISSGYIYGYEGYALDNWCVNSHPV